VSLSAKLTSGARNSTPGPSDHDLLSPPNVCLLVGLAAILFSLLYFASDVIEAVNGGFSTLQLAMTYAAEAAIPFIVIGLYAVQRPRIGLLGFTGAIAYAYAYVFFAGTVVYALVNSTDDFDTLGDELGAWIPIHGTIMVLAGLAFGTAVIRARVLPAWTGLTLMAGVVLVAATSGAPDAARTASAGVRDLAFIGMGAALLVGLQGQNAR